MLVAARENLWRAQERLGIKPAVTVVVNGFPFRMDDPVLFGLAPATFNDPPRFQEPYLKCTMPNALLRRILTREVHWNNAELACDILFDRRPNVFNPDVHTLMSFFHL